MVEAGAGTRAMYAKGKVPAELEVGSSAEAREIRLLFERHSAFEAIRELFFCLTKSMATLACRHREEVAHAQLDVTHTCCSGFALAIRSDIYSD